MDLQKITVDLLKQYKITPNDEKSQNFLICNQVYDKIIASAGLQTNDTVLEIGPGLGFLTAQLIGKAKKVIAVEIDKRLFNILTNLQNVSDNLQIINQDIMKFDETALPAGYQIIANLPYHLTARIFKKFLSSENKPQAMTVLVQKEVAERICALPGQHSLLSLSIQYYGRPKFIEVVEKDCFYPAPQVDSAILRISDIKQYVNRAEEKKFWQVARIGFSNKRKTLAHNLSAGFKKDKSEIKQLLKKVGLKEMIRAQELSLTDWKKIISNL